MPDDAHWAERMPWRLMGVGAVLLAGMLGWHFIRDRPVAMHGDLALNAQARLGAGVVPIADEPAPSPPAPPRAAPPVQVDDTDPGLDVTVVVEGGVETIVEEESYVETVPAPEPHRLVILVQERAPAPPPVTRGVVQGRVAGFRGGDPGGGFTPPRAPSGPLTPRSNQSPRRRPAARIPARGGAGRVGFGGSTRRRSSATRRR